MFVVTCLCLLQLCDEWRESVSKGECLDPWWSELKKKVIANKQYSKVKKHVSSFEAMTPLIVL